MSAIGSGYFNYSSPSYSSFSGVSGNTGLLGDYMSIRSGSYKKLLKAYYAQEKNTVSSSGQNKEAMQSSEVKAVSAAKSDASSLKKATDALSDRRLYAKVTKTEKDEKTGETTTTTDYDRDAIVSAVKDFAKAYNSTLDSVTNQDNLSILRKTSYMTKSTGVNKNSLASVGITIGADNKLSVDEDKVKSADISALKSLFSGADSYAAGVGKRASDINSLAEQAIKRAGRGNANIYTNSGNYSGLSTGDLFNTLF